MSRKPTLRAAAQTRAQTKALREEMARVAEFLERKTREAIAEGLFDPVPTHSASAVSREQILEARIVGDEVVVHDGGDGNDRN